MLNFIIPVRDHSSIENWGIIKRNLANTLNSIRNQSDDNWHCYIVCNTGCDLPELPNNKFEVIYIDFKNDSRVHSDVLKVKYDAIREDKGNRVYQALKRVVSSDHIMVVDYDDFVSSELSDFVNNNQNNAGWYIAKGYYYSGGNYLLKEASFDTKCGTSNIIKASFIYKFLNTDNELPLDIIKELLGSHVFIKKYMRSSNTNFESLPFPGAIYNIGVSESTSGTGGIIHNFFNLKTLLTRPDRFIRRVFSIRFTTIKIKNSFCIK